MAKRKFIVEIDYDEDVFWGADSGFWRNLNSHGVNHIKVIEKQVIYDEECEWYDD